MTEREKAAFEKGRMAYRRGKHLRDCPYTHETAIQSANFRAWVRGWETEEQESGDAA